jgi:hypothetical protein
MRIVRPATIDDAALISTTAAETVAAYDSGTTYALGQQVRDDATHRIFESGQNANLGNALADPAWWFDVGPANQWAMFDTVNGTVTTGPAGLDVVVQPVGRIDSVALLNLDAATAQIIMTDATDGEIYNETFNLVAEAGITDWYAYFYEPIVRRNLLILTGLPLYSGPEIEVILAAGGGGVSVGTMIVGQVKQIGSTEAGASVGIVDYSRKEADDFGNYQLVQRAFARKASFRVMIDGGEVDEIDRLLSQYRATPILYIGSEIFGAAAVFGFYRDFNIEIAYPTYAFCSLELEGLT